MPEKKTIERAREDAREGKSPSTQAGEFVREEIHHIREGKHGARSTQQAIAIGLSKARRAGVKLKTPKKGTVSEETRRAAARDTRKAKSGVKREGRSAASPQALAKQARSAARRRSAASRSASAKKGARTKGPAKRRAAAKKAARTRARR
jgi:hypothetical protein